MSATQHDARHDAQHDGAGQSDLSRISTEMVRLYKDQFGRGPTGARSSWSGDNVIVCMLEDTFTPAERNLVRMGEHERLREMRMFFQYATVRDFCDPVEKITGRTVRAFISGIDTWVGGLSMETFVFYPADGPPGLPRADLAEAA
jgi:uncharacterized protein YbcI